MEKEMRPCVFCKVDQNTSEVIYQDKYFYSRFDRFPCTPGHLEIIPKKHIASLSDLTIEEWQQYFPAIQNTIQEIHNTNLKKLYEEFVQNPLNNKSKEFCEAALKHPHLEDMATDHIIGWNNGQNAGRTVHHLHLHIIPAFPGDILPGGIRYSVPGKGNYK